MSTHRADTPKVRRSRSGRARALLSLGAVAILASGFSIKGTFAFWTDSATVQTGSFQSGNLDITLNGGLVGQGGSTTLTALALTNMAPGEAVAANVTLANAGSIGLTYTISGTASGDLAPGMRISLFRGAASTASRVMTCSGTQIGATATLSSIATTFGAAQALATGGTDDLCVRVELPLTADNSFQSKTMTASLVFDAKQVGA